MDGLSALALLPVLTFGALFLVLWGSLPSATDDPRDWRTAFVGAGVLWGTLVVLFSEALSLLQLIQRGPLAATWGAALLLVVRIGWRRGYLQKGWQRLLLARGPESWMERGLLGGMAVIAAAVLAIAWISPPNNVDSFIYHMTRVVHWAQAGSLRHYPAIHDVQLIRPHWPALAILNLRVLWGSDQPANLIQWFSMIGSIVAATGVARLLGAGLRGQLLAAAGVVSIPMGVLQASSTQNDYAIGFWAISLAYLVLLSKRQPLTRGESVLVALAAGLGFLTKGTFFAYGPPLVLWYLLPGRRFHALRRSLSAGVMVGLATAVLSLGLWARNIATYGGPYGPSDRIRVALGILHWFVPREPPATSTPAPTLPAGVPLTDPSPTPEGSAGLFGTTPYAAMTLSGGLPDELGKALTLIVSMLGWNMVTPSSAVNEMLQGLMARLPWVFTEGYLLTLKSAAWNHEDSAGNPVHLMLVPVTLLILLARRGKLTSSLPFPYAAAVLLGYAMLPIVATAGSGNWGIRYQLPFFVLWSAALGSGAAALGRPRISGIAGVLLLLSAIPYVLLNNTRPLVGLPPWPTAIRSILVASPEEVLFATNRGLRDDYAAVTEAISRTDCRQVGLRIESNVFEYPFWWLLAAPQSGRRIEGINVGPPLDRYNDPTFEPCAIICSFCQEHATLQGLPRSLSHDSLQLFIAPSP